MISGHIAGFKRQFSIPLIKQFTYIILIFSGLLSAFILLNQYHKLKREKYEELEKAAFHINKGIESSIVLYNLILDQVSLKLLSNNLISKPKEISALFKQFHQGGREGKGRIGFTDLYWYDEAHNSLVSKFNISDRKSPFPANIENGLRENSQQPIFHIESDKSKSHTHFQLLYVKGLASSNKFPGKIVIACDAMTWLGYLGTKISSEGNAAIITTQEGEVAFASNLSLLYTRFSSSYLNTNSPSFKHHGYVFSRAIKIPYSDYTILIGYNERHFYSNLYDVTYYKLAIIWLFAVVSFILLLTSHRQINSYTQALFANQTDTLEAANLRLLQELAEIKSVVSSLEKELEAIYNARSEHTALSSEISTSHSDKLIEIKETLKALIHAGDGKIKVAITPDKQADILTDLHNRLVYLSENVACSQEKKVDLAEILSSLTKLFAKEIYQNNLTFKSQISSSAQGFIFSKMLLQQIIISLAVQVFESARPNGQITISVRRQKERLNLSIRDNGFYTSENFLDSETENNKSHFSPIALNMQTVRKLIENHHGSLEISRNREFRVIEMILSEQVNKVRDGNILNTNVIPLFKSLT